MTAGWLGADAGLHSRDKGVATCMRTFRFSHALVVGLSMVVLLVLASVSAVAGQAREGCTLETLNGAWGNRETGVLVTDGTKQDLALVSRTVFDGHGHFSGVDTVSLNGQIARHETFSGTYTVNADCTSSDTGTVTSGPLSGLVFHEDCVAVDRGKQAFCISTDPGSVLSGTAIRQGD